MTFPQTRRSVIQAVAAGDDAAWHDFVREYWGPLCRFALRGGRLSLSDAEDVAAETIVVLLKNRLLARWIEQPAARLHTLLCRVVWNLLSNRWRVAQGRRELLRQHRDEVEARPWVQVGLEEPAVEQDDAFYTAWVEELLQATVEVLLREYHGQGRGDHFRVLYGRLCEGLTARAVAEALGWSLSQSENAYKDAVRRLRRCLEERVRRHVEHYCPAEETEAEFRSEWVRLEEYLTRQGGLEQTVRAAYQGLDPEYGPERKLSAVRSTLLRLEAGAPKG
jgi:DNA-directed RNA polymerase specialized sigma24 family protein